MKILSVFSLLVTASADFKASPVCIAGTTCLGFGVLAAQEAFHSNHENDAASDATKKADAPPEPTFGAGSTGAWGSCDSFFSWCGSGLTCTSNRKCSPNASPGESCGDSAGGVDCADSAGGKNWCTESGDGWRCSSGEEGQVCSSKVGQSGCNTGLDCISKGYCVRKAKDGEPCGGGSGITCEEGSDCTNAKSPGDWRLYEPALCTNR